LSGLKFVKIREFKKINKIRKKFEFSIYAVYSLCCWLVAAVRGSWVTMMSTVLYRGGHGLINLAQLEKTPLSDSERLEMLEAINNFRSDVRPTAADMIELVRCRRVLTSIIFQLAA